MLRSGALVLAMLITVACGGAAPGASLPASAAPPSSTSPLEALQGRAGEGANRLTARDWAGYALFASSDLLAACPPGRLGTLLATERLLLRTLLGITDDQAVEVRVEEVAVDGNEGQVVLSLVADGAAVEGSESADRWMHDGIDWRLDDESWREACA